MTDKAVDSFLALAATRLAPKTVEAYRRDLADAADFLKASPAGASSPRTLRQSASSSSARVRSTPCCGAQPPTEQRAEVPPQHFDR